MLLERSGGMPSSNAFLESVPRSRSDMRLAMRANHWYSMPPLVARREQDSLTQQSESENHACPSPETCYQMEALVPLASTEDDAWLNDVAQPRSKPAPSLANEHVLLCWL